MPVKKERSKRKHESEKTLDTTKTFNSTPNSEQLNSNAINNSKSDEESDKNDEIEENYVVPNKKKTVFSVKSFRKDLTNTEKRLNSIKEFINLCNDKDSATDYVLEYLEGGGTLMEILKMLDGTEKQDLPWATPIFEAANLILLKIQALMPEQKPTAEEAARYILNNHLPTLNAMFSQSSTTRQKRVVLKLLTSMVTLSQLLAKEILLNVNFHLHLDTLVQPADGNQFNSVRVSYIYFILAFIIDQNTSIIRHLLDKKNCIHSIIPNLIYDDYKIVNLVLSSLRTHIIENPSVSKTLKLYIFNTNTLKNIVNLYNWKGRKFWKLKVRKKATNLPENITDLAEKEIVCNAVHNFLLILCTSRKYGIIFHDKMLGLSGQKTNKLIFTVLEQLEKPWDNKYAAELVIKIAGACHDLYPYTIAMVENYLEPRASPKWLNVIKFVKGIVEILTADTIMDDLRQLTPKQILTVIQKFCIPNVIVKSLGQNKFMSHGDPYIREVSIDLLITLLKNLDSYIQAVQKETILNDPKLIQPLFESLLKVLPNLESLSNTWSMLENKSIYLDSALIFREYLKEFHIKIGILDILICYYRIFPEILDGIENKFKPEQILVDVKNCDDIILKQKIIVKASELFMLCDPTIFSPEKTYFHGYLDILLSIRDANALKILTNIFRQTGIFDNNSNEINIWLEPNLLCDESVRNLLITAVHETSNNLDSCIDQIVELKAKIDVGYSKEAEIDEIFNLLEHDNVVVQKIRHVVVSPLIISFLKLYANKTTPDLQENDWKYFENVLVNLFHTQTIPEILIQLIAQYNLKKKYSKHILNYINSWNQEIRPLPTNFPGSDYELMNKLSEILLSNDATEQDLRNIFKIDNSDHFTLTVGDTVYEISSKWRENLNINKFHMLLFYLTQLNNKKLLTLQQINIFLQLIFIIIEIIDTKQQNLIELLTLIYNNPTIVTKFVPFARKKQMAEKIITEFLLKLTIYFKNRLCTNSQLLIEPFRSKLLIRMKLAVKNYQKHLQTSDIDYLMLLINTFELDVSDCFTIVTELIVLPTDVFISNEQTLSIFSYILAYSLEKLSLTHETVEMAVFSPQQFNLLQKHFINFNKNFVNVNIDVVLEKFLKFIQKFPHYISEITSSFFKSFIEKSTITKFDINLICYLCEREIKFLKYVDKNFDQILQNKDLIFPLITILQPSSNFQKYLNAIYVQYEHLILKTIEKPHKIGLTIRNNVASVIKLIENGMPIDQCQKFTQKIHKYEIAEEFHLNFIETIFNKCIKNSTDQTTTILIISNYLQTLINLTKNYFKFTRLDKITIIFDKIQHFVKMHRSVMNENLKIFENSSWNIFVKFCLKYGIKKTVTSNDERSHAHILQTLHILYDIYCKRANLTAANLNELETTYEMIQTHSEFLNVILDHSNSQTKTAILKLLLTLSKCHTKMLSVQLVSILLGAYTATISLNDQLIVSILYLYERSDIDLEHLKPFVWGEFAISHYSVRQNIKDSLWRKPTMMAVLDLLKYDMVMNTIRNFDVRRSFLLLEHNERLLDMGKVAQNRSSCFNDKFVESTNKGEYLTTRTYIDTHVGDVYDMNFLLPLFSHLLQSNSVVRCYKFVQSGAFSLTLIALASNCILVRQAAYNVLARFYFHLEANTTTKERKIWLEFINRIRLGITNLCDEKTNNNSKRLTRLKISSISAQFLARGALIMTHPLNPLYIPINNFIFVKQAIDFQIVPELLEMFHSGDVDYQIYRQWILQIIRDGLKSGIDVQVMWKSVAFKMFMDFYSSHALCSDTKTAIFILEILEMAVIVRKGMRFLLFERSLLPWLHGILLNLNSSNIKQIDIVLRICNNLYMSVCNFDVNKLGYVIQLLSLLLKILHLFTSNISMASYLLFIKLLSKCIKDNYHRLTREQIDRIITLGTHLIGANDCKYILKFGSKYICVEEIDENSILDEKLLITHYLRTLTIDWTKNCCDLINENDNNL